MPPFDYFQRTQNTRTIDIVDGTVKEYSMTVGSFFDELLSADGSAKRLGPAATDPATIVRPLSC